MDKDSLITVTGGYGFLGQCVMRQLKEKGYQNVHTFDSFEFDLTSQNDVEDLYDEYRPEVVIHLAAEVGGIGANRKHPGRFFYANMAMGLNLIEQGRLWGIEKFVHVGTVCSYPKFTPVPFREEELWNGYPEETNAPYGIAKKALMTMLDAYHREYGLKSAVVVPVNLYGPGDNFDKESSHVIPALIQKCVEARESGAEEILCWGTGMASREFLYVEDCAEAIVLAAEKMEKPIPINLGTGHEMRIDYLTNEIAAMTGFEGSIRWDCSKPDGQPRRCLNVERAHKHLGWWAKTPFEEGLKRTIDWYENLRKS